MKKETIPFLCKKEYVIRGFDEDDYYSRKFPNADVAFRINKIYNAKKSEDHRFLYDFDFGYLTYSARKEEMEKYFYTSQEIRKLKLQKIRKIKLEKINENT